MLLKQIIKQTETLNEKQQKKLASYFVLKYLNPDVNLLQIFYNTEFDIQDNNIDEKKNAKKRKLQFSNNENFGNIDMENLRNDIYSHL